MTANLTKTEAIFLISFRPFGEFRIYSPAELYFLSIIPFALCPSLLELDSGLSSGVGSSGGTFARESK